MRPCAIRARAAHLGVKSSCAAMEPQAQAWGSAAKPRRLAKRKMRAHAKVKTSIHNRPNANARPCPIRAREAHLGVKSSCAAMEPQAQAWGSAAKPRRLAKRKKQAHAKVNASIHNRPNANVRPCAIRAREAHLGVKSSCAAMEPQAQAWGSAAKSTTLGEKKKTSTRQS